MKSYVEQAREAIAQAEHRLGETPVIPEVYELFNSIVKALQMLNIALAEQARKNGQA